MTLIGLANSDTTGKMMILRLLISTPDKPIQDSDMVMSILVMVHDLSSHL